MIFETHVHLCDSRYDEDRDAMLERADKAGVKWFLNIGAELAETRKVMEYAAPGVYRAIGCHPHYVGECTDEGFGEIASAIKAGGITAVGEIGLDYFKSPSPKEEQEKAFRAFLGVAKEAGLPVVIHSRDAHEDTLRILNEYAPEKRGIIHCFTGAPDTAKRFADAGYMLGIGGVLTFPNAGTLRETVKELPLSAMVLETDAPWLAPQSMRGKRNEPAYLKEIVSAIAGIKGVSAEEVERVTTENATKILGLKI